MRFVDQMSASLTDWSAVQCGSAASVSHHAAGPASTLTWTCWGGFIKPACLGVATAPLSNKSRPVNGFDSSAISSAIISLWAGTDRMLSVACYLKVTRCRLSLQCGDGSASPPVVLRTSTGKEKVDYRATRGLEARLGLPRRGSGAGRDRGTLTLCLCNGWW